MSKTYSVQAKTCVKGEALFESLIAEYAIPHHVIAPKDIGVDYICEWVHGDDPTGTLFAAQVKTFTVDKTTAPRSLGHDADRKFSGLEAFAITNSNLIIDQDTLDYWKGLGLPTYLFVVAITKGDGAQPDSMAMFYKRFTHVLTRDVNQKDERFLRVDDNGVKFRAFADEQGKTHGFARDLFVDLMRWTYFKGSIAWLNPRKLGLNQFSEKDNVFRDLMQDYKTQICETYLLAKKYLEELCEGAGNE
jgi:hypothetical protein